MLLRCSWEDPLLKKIEDDMLFVWEGINLELVKIWVEAGGTVIILELVIVLKIGP